MHKILSTLIGTALLLVFAVGSLHAVHLVNPAGKAVTISYGKTFRIVYNQSSGLYNVYSGQQAIISAAYAEVKNGEAVSRRLARGEVKMHMVQTGPKWWGEEFHYGYMLSLKMLSQPGFLVIAVYVAWMYAQIVLIIIVYSPS